MPAEPAPEATPSGFGLRRLDDAEGTFFVLRDGVNRIGTRNDNEVVLEAAGVSRLHAEITLAGGGARIADLASKNGTLVNGEVVAEAPVAYCDEIKLGRARLRVEPTPAADADLAIRLSSSRRAAATRGEDTPSLAPPAPADPLTLVETALVRAASPNTRGDRAALLRTLLPLLGVDGGAWVRVEPSPAGALLHAAAGRMPVPEGLAARVAEAADGLARFPQDALVIVRRNAAADGTGVALAFWGARAAGLDGRLLGILGDVAALAQGSTDDPPPRPPAAAARVADRGAEELAGSQPPSALRFPPGYVPGRSAAAEALHREIAAVSRTDIPVLILGETGVGKEQVARLVHRSSERANGPFVALNCAAIPADLVEAELFGIGRGVATGVVARAGQFVRARGGTLLLDEVGELSLAVQVKLLRVLQEGEVHPLGGDPVAIDVRIVAATNADLAARIASGRFRSDLYYRLAGSVVDVPPLRHRRDDLPDLIAHLSRRFAHEARRRVRGVTVEALAVLTAYPWPGNVRELENEIRRLVLCCADGQAIHSGLLSSALRPADPASSPFALEELNLARLEQRAVARALERTGGNRAQAARLLGISRFALRRRLER